MYKVLEFILSQFLNIVLPLKHNHVAQFLCFVTDTHIIFKVHKTTLNFTPAFNVCECKGGGGGDCLGCP